MIARREKIMEMSKELERAMQSISSQPPIYTPVSAEGPTVTLTQSQINENTYGEI
jgi:hypothetical protein